ncbi:MAG TPA: 50S ribosomal protein L10 [Candidatus Saccharimonadales bacterium]|nr:50S ribosomal protein L10 [Candidatus Saccharimonadales bacterium]
MPNNKKLESVKELREKVAKAKSIIVAEYQGLKSNDANNFRAKMLEAGAEVTVAKNTLLNIAMKEEKLETEQFSPHLKGSTVTIFAYEDPISPLKAIIDFAKKLQLPKLKGAMIAGKYTTVAELEVLSTLPSRQQLLGQVVSTLNAPLSGFLNVLSGSKRKFVIALAEVAKKK